MILEPPNDIEVLYTLALIEAQVTGGPGMDLLANIKCLEDYERHLTTEDLRFLYELRIAG